MNKTSFGKGLQDGIPIGLGYFAVSFTFGIMAIQSGLTAWQAVLISLTNLTSAGQFSGIGIIAAGGTDAAGYQLKILSDVFFSVTETGKRCFQWTQTCGCVWCDR